MGVVANPRDRRPEPKNGHAEGGRKPTPRRGPVWARPCPDCLAVAEKAGSGDFPLGIYTESALVLHRQRFHRGEE